MGWNDPDIYNQPEHYGLEIIGEIGYHGWEFDILVVFKETATGRLGIAEDSGCSCYAPFERFTDVEEIDFDEPWKLAMRIQEYANVSYHQVSENDTVHLIDKVVNA